MKLHVDDLSSKGTPVISGAEVKKNSKRMFVMRGRC